MFVSYELETLATTFMYDDITRVVCSYMSVCYHRSHLYLHSLAATSVMNLKSKELLFLYS